LIVTFADSTWMIDLIIIHLVWSRNPHAVTKALVQVVTHSKAQTMMGLEKDLKDAADSLIRCELTPPKKIGIQ
jgi:hypothetical protein